MPINPNYIHGRLQQYIKWSEHASLTTRILPIETEVLTWYDSLQYCEPENVYDLLAEISRTHLCSRMFWLSSIRSTFVSASESVATRTSALAHSGTEMMSSAASSALALAQDGVWWAARHLRERMMGSSTEPAPASGGATADRAPPPYPSVFPAPLPRPDSPVGSPVYMVPQTAYPYFGSPSPQATSMNGAAGDCGTGAVPVTDSIIDAMNDIIKHFIAINAEYMKDGKGLFERLVLTPAFMKNLRAYVIRTRQTSAEIYARLYFPEPMQDLLNKADAQRPAPELSRNHMRRLGLDAPAFASPASQHPTVSRPLAGVLLDAELGRHPISASEAESRAHLMRAWQKGPSGKPGTS